MVIEAFLSAYDPTDLPGGSVDPLGFERGYLFLADKILPGLTNVASHPRYFSMLCAGAYISDNVRYVSPRTQYQERLQRVLRLERFWALANVLASYETGKDYLELSGLRGVTYAKARVDDIRRKGNTYSDADFKLLSRQLQYGAVGIYGVVSDGLRFWDRKTLTLTPDLGWALAEGFIEETEIPREVVKAVEEDSRVRLDNLTEWGERAHVNNGYVATEAKCFADGLNQNPIRSKMTEILSDHPPLDDKESELSRLKRIYHALESDTEATYYRDALRVILSYENAYRWVLLGFERILWLCRNDQSGSISSDDLEGDPVFSKIPEKLPGDAKRFIDFLERCETDEFRLDLPRLLDVRTFLESAAISCNSPKGLADSIMARHREVQRGKFDKGRHKLPWIEYTAGERIALTSTRVGGLDHETTSPSEMISHPYRTYSADALYRAARL